VPLQLKFSSRQFPTGSGCGKMRGFWQDWSPNMLEINPLVQALKDIQARKDVLRGYL